MEKEIINKLIKELKKNVDFEGNDKVKFTSKGYEAVEIDKKNFHKINKINSDRKISFVDGGNQEIIKAANFSLQLIRVYFNIFKNNKKIKVGKREFFALIRTDNLDYVVDFFGNYFDELKDLCFDSMDKNLRTGNHRVVISRIGDIVRRFSELIFATEVANFLENGDLIVLDGDLKADRPGEREFLDSLYGKSVEKGVVVAGLSKTTSLLTEKGNSLGALLNQKMKGEWYYYPIVKIENENHKAEMFFVRLSSKGKRIFRFEVSKETKFEIDELLTLLMKNARDPIFLGYPYGLIDADKFARITNSETEYYRTMIMAKLGKEWENIEKFTSALDAHEILDNIS